MAFSSNVFLFLFLPLFLLVYFSAPARLRNLALMLASLFFYAFLAGGWVWLLLGTIVFDHVVALALAGSEGRRARWLLAAGVTANLAVLVAFKYAGWLLSSLGIAPDAGTGEAPVGISFFVFLGIAYLVDVHRRTIEPARRFVDFGIYMACFPKDLAGPITRFGEIAAVVRDRPVTLEGFFQGVWRFSIGLGKKVLIADNVGRIADEIFALSGDELSQSLVWLAVLAFTLQIFFDFAGYTDMAIGLGRMLGFTFPENFDQPYRAPNVTDFWRRWHMSLTRWFRDYLYIPLGGNRRGRRRTYANLFIVFVLCGLWHGAAITFLLWGLYHGCLLAAERVVADRWGFRPSGPIGVALTLLLVMLGWVLFRAASPLHALVYYVHMLGLPSGEGATLTPAYFLHGDRAYFLVAGIVLALAPTERLRTMTWSPRWAPLQAATALPILVWAAAGMSVQGVQPFIYFRF